MSRRRVAGLSGWIVLVVITLCASCSGKGGGESNSAERTTGDSLADLHWHADGFGDVEWGDSLELAKEKLTRDVKQYTVAPDLCEPSITRILTSDVSLGFTERGFVGYKVRRNVTTAHGAGVGSPVDALWSDFLPVEMEEGQAPHILRVVTLSSKGDEVVLWLRTEESHGEPILQDPVQVATPAMPSGSCG